MKVKALEWHVRVRNGSFSSIINPGFGAVGWNVEAAAVPRTEAAGRWSMTADGLLPG